MTDYIGSILFKFSDPEIFAFQSGFLSGVIVFAVLAILIKVMVMIIFGYPKKVDGIPVEGENGTLFISSTAVSDLVESLEPSFKSVEITKVSLMKDKKRSHFVRVDVIYNIGGGDMTAIASMMQTSIITQLKEVFGISTITSVDIRVKRSKEKKNRF